MKDEKFFDFVFPDGIPACIQTCVQEQTPDHIDWQAFEFFARIDEDQEQSNGLFATDFDSLRHKCLETFDTILLERLHLGYKTQEFKKIETAIKEAVSFDVSTLNPDELIKNKNHISNLRLKAIMAFNSIIKSLENIEFLSFGTKHQLAIFWETMQISEMNCRTQTKSTLNLLLSLTAPTDCNRSDSNPQFL